MKKSDVIECVPLAMSRRIPHPNFDQPRYLDAHQRVIRLLSLLAQTPVIPAVRSLERLEAATAAPGKIIYLLCGDLENICDMIDRVLAHGKAPVVNLDLVSGLARDQAAVTHLARCGIQGIISTHGDPLRNAQKLGLFAIQRSFMIDSGAVHSLLKSLNQFVPDALEILPALAAPKVLPRLRLAHASLPIIAGGLLDSMQEAEYCFQKGVNAVSLSDERLWIV
jgi:glycerol uptake operon antiterminator